MCVVNLIANFQGDRDVWITFRKTEFMSISNFDLE
jgi:hypothetical protein